MTDEPYERIVHVRICGGRRAQARPLPGNHSTLDANDLWTLGQLLGYSASPDSLPRRSTPPRPASVAAAARPALGRSGASAAHGRRASRPKRQNTLKGEWRLLSA